MADVVVIGGGVGGMAAAIRLAARGHAVTLFESRTELGGKLAEVRRDGFTFGVGPSLLTLPGVFDDLAREAGARLTDLADLVPVDPVCRYRFADGGVLDAPRDPAAMAEAVDRFAPGQGGAWRRYFAWGRRAWAASERSFFSGPVSFPPPARPGARLGDLLAVAPARTLAGHARAFFTDPRLVQYACRYATYSGSSPYAAPAAVGCIPYLEHAHGGWYVRGGLTRLRDALSALLAAAGAQVRTGARVASVLTTPPVAGSPSALARAHAPHRIPSANERVAAVVVDGEQIPADVVVADIDVGRFYQDLLPRAENMRRLDRLGPSSSAFLALCGVRGRTPGLAHHNIVFSADYRAEFADIFRRRRPPADPTVYVGCSAAQEDGQAPAGHENWVILVNVPAGNLAGWRAAARPYLGLVLDRLAAAGLDARQRLVFADVLTPADIAARYGAWHGAIYGTALTGRLSPLRRPGNRGAVRGLYHVGGSVHPGGGLPLVVMGSRIVTDLVEDDLGAGAARCAR